jgi:hypothetical protein
LESNIKKPPKRSIRRHHYNRIKERAKKIIKNWGGTDLSDKNVGKVASVHGASCSCWMCGNPRHISGERTKQEISMDQNENDQKKDLKNNE